MLNTSSNSPTPKPNALERQEIETNRLKVLVEKLQTELFQMSIHYQRMGWHAGFDDYYSQRREVKTKLTYAERDLERSKAKERVLRGAMERRLLAVA